jgi:hypothetical protein
MEASLPEDNFVEVTVWRPVVHDVLERFLGKHVPEDVVPGTVNTVGHAAEVSGVVHPAS